MKNSDSLGVQLKTVWLSGVSTHNLMENLFQLILKLPEDV
jgi:hypothetical protein